LAIKVTGCYPVEFVSHVSYSLLLTGIHVIAPLSRLATKRPDCLFRLPPQVQESVVFTYRSPHFCSPEDVPAIITQYVAWMERQFSACQKPCSMYPPICNSFPVIRTASAKNRRFHVPQPTFLIPLETPLRLSHNMLHG